MKVFIAKGGKRRCEIEVSPRTTVGELKSQIAARLHVASERQSLKYGESQIVRLSDDSKRLEDYGVKEGLELSVTDLGIQIGYRTVFLCEYLGPLVIMLLFACRPSLVYGVLTSHKPYSSQALMGIGLWVLHYAKRLLESVFVHKFSHATMPLFNIFKNSIYYWGFAAMIAYPLCSPLYTPNDQNVMFFCSVAMVITEFLNFLVHFQFSTMRTADGSQERPIPKGPLFVFVTSPNYFFEVLSWIFFSIGTKIAMSYVFALAGFAQMYVWAVKKQVNYIKTYGDEYRSLKRKVIIPFLL